MNSAELFALAARYEAGESLRSLSDALGMHPSYVRARLLDLGVEIRTPGRQARLDHGVPEPTSPQVLRKCGCGTEIHGADYLCRLCRWCNCPPKRRVLVRSYGGQWMDRICEKLVERLR